MAEYQIRYKKLIVTCEGCGKVVRYDIQEDTDIEKIFKEFQCPNECGRNFYAFISIGEFGKTIDAKK